MKRISWFTDVETPKHCSRQRVKPAWTVTLDTHHCPVARKRGRPVIKFYDWLLKLSIGNWQDGCATFQKGNLSVSVFLRCTLAFLRRCVPGCGVGIPTLWHRNQGLHYSEFFNNVMPPHMTLKLICQRGCQMGIKTAPNTRNSKYILTQNHIHSC